MQPEQRQVGPIEVLDNDVAHEDGVLSDRVEDAGLGAEAANL